MISKTVEQKIASGDVIPYRRVSTPDQAEDGYRHQLQVIKSIYPSFSIRHSTDYDYKEVMSGLANMGKRSASKIGTAIGKLKRHPQSIILVSDADRISRRQDVFEVIQKQGLGHRIFVASSGLSLDEVVALGHHKKIEQQTQEYKEACRLGQQRYRDNGGIIGSPDIKHHSKSGAQKKSEQAKERKVCICKIISRLTYANRGQKPSHGEICDVLRDSEIRTGQGYFFTAPKLQQLKKGMASEWDYAMDSWHRPRRRISGIIEEWQREIRRKNKVCRIHRLISHCQIELNRKRQRQLSTKRLLAFLSNNAFWHVVVGRSSIPLRSPIWSTTSEWAKGNSRDGCRGPPIIRSG
ncbi:hypothetical protein D1821_04645 [Phaeobacter inhibens]|uniref:hypothetical protein n=1 Tax=Phaeobacter inhibens TaxID=221822 RepID=UPI000160DB95|nr:hypothetical protein [Phaeobacter inhibens]AFO86914.1 hypothetical protein PGA2_c09020 [Phaeobacter inhibens 2.10]AXT41726.1 hypothetical protein D1821_04645 [Phaeobacter inhibens]